MTRFPRAVEKAIFEKDEETCRICGRTTEFGDGEIDHKTPKSKGGGDDYDNLQWACHRCNKLKGNKRTDEEVRRILSLPEKFDDIIRLRTKEKAVVLPQPETQNKLPVLSRKDLDVSSVDKCISLLQESYQTETVISEVCNRITAVEEATTEFAHIGVHFRLPRLWFLPYEVTHQAFCNDLLFTQFGRSIALAEQKYFEDSILGNEAISRINVAFSPNGILRAVEKMRSRGSEPTMITFPLSFWTDLYRWSGDACVEYSTADPRPKLDSTLVLKGNRLTIINPLGSFPKEPLLLSKDAVEWVARRNPEGALYVVFGNHQLYPLKYVELLTGISVKSAVNPEEVSILNFG